MSKTSLKSKKRCRHSWGPMQDHSFKDGTYQVCTKCGVTRFYGDRYSAYSRLKG